MPGFNQRGPIGQGPLTGRRMGRCTNFGANDKTKASGAKENPDEKTDEIYPEDMPQRPYGNGFGFGRGAGRGRGRWGRGPGMGMQNRFRGGF